MGRNSDNPPKSIMCDGKASFRSEKFARGRMRQYWQDFDAGMVPYQCAYCHKWHIGHIDEVRPKQRRMKGISDE
jgi:hypothetical protein